MLQTDGQTDRQTDGQTTYDSNTALALRASRCKNSVSYDVFLDIQQTRLDTIHEGQQQLVVIDETCIY